MDRYITDLEGGNSLRQLPRVEQAGGVVVCGGGVLARREVERRAEFGQGSLVGTCRGIPEGGKGALIRVYRKKIPNGAHSLLHHTTSANLFHYFAKSLTGACSAVRLTRYKPRVGGIPKGVCVVVLWPEERSRAVRNSVRAA